jgi:APA family basic amino acid/polyamine antiporter
MADESLKRCLNGFDLILMGIGAIIGAGVFVLTGVAAATKAGPAISISYVIAGFAAMFSALAYTELATSIGGCGSAYNYAYVGFGKFTAWVIGWILLLEYTFSVATVAIGWSGYVNNTLMAANIYLPQALIKGPLEGGIINLPAFSIIIALAALLAIGVKQSARFNAVIVAIKLTTVAIFIIIAMNNVHPENWHPYMPFGWQGVMQGAAFVFYAYIGFDALSTAAEETIKPQRNIPIGIIGSVIICSIIYITVSGLLTGIAPYTSLNVDSPVADALLTAGHPTVAGIIAVGAVAGLTTVMLVMYYGLTRVSLAIARDRMLPHFFAHLNPQTQTPIRVIVLTGVIIAAIAGFAPMGQAAELVNIGTLAAFTLVCVGVIVMRRSRPKMPRPFKLPWNPVIPALGIILCVYLMTQLPAVTWRRFIIWTAFGLVVFAVYGRKHGLERPKE